jgi:hypothetical protein
VIDIYRFELSGLFVVAIILSLVAPCALFAPHYLPSFSFLPMFVRGIFYLYGPLVAFLLWLATVFIAVRVHRWRGLWLLTTAVIMLPGTYLFGGLVWGCVLFGACI